MLKPQERNDVRKLAAEIRVGILTELHARGFGHVGGSLSVADVLAVLYGNVMRVNPQNPGDPMRDKLVCSKGHAGPAVYAALACRGFIDKEELKTLNQPGTHLPSHCDRNKTPGVDMTTGSLGQGTSLAVGMALGDKLKGRDTHVYLIVGDGELNEGQVWEAAMFSAAKQIDNITWIIDNNKKQLDGYTRDILDAGDLQLKFAAFGFDAVAVDGHDLDQLHDALTRRTVGKPVAVIMDTVKGKGIKEVEETVSNHSMNVSKEKWQEWLDMLVSELDSL